MCEQNICLGVEMMKDVAVFLVSTLGEHSYQRRKSTWTLEIYQNFCVEELKVNVLYLNHKGYNNYIAVTPCSPFKLLWQTQLCYS